MMTTGELHKLGVIVFEFEEIYDERKYKKNLLKIIKNCNTKYYVLSIHYIIF